MIHKHRPGISPVIGTLIFLLVAIVAFASFGTIISRGLSFNQAAIDTALLLNERNKEMLVVVSLSSPVILPLPPPSAVVVGNRGSTTSIIEYTFGINQNGSLVTLPQSLTAIPPGGNQTLNLPAAGPFTLTGVITQLGNTFYTGVETGVPIGGTPPILVGGSLSLPLENLFFFNARQGNNPIGFVGDGFPLLAPSGGYSAWPIPGGSVEYVFSLVGDQRRVAWRTEVTNLDPSRNITLGGASVMSFTTSVSTSLWYIVGNLVDSAPFTSGVRYEAYNSPITLQTGQTASIYFAAPIVCTGQGGLDPCGNTDAPPSQSGGYGPSEAANIILFLTGSYSDNTPFTGLVEFRPTYFTRFSLNPIPGQNPVTMACSPSPCTSLSGPSGTVFTFALGGNWVAPPRVYWLNAGGTVTDVTTGTPTLTTLQFTIPPRPPGYYQIFVTDGSNFVDCTVQVT